jgi:hypothetical protein
MVGAGDHGTRKGATAEATPDQVTEVGTSPIPVGTAAATSLLDVQSWLVDKYGLHLDKSQRHSKPSWSRST